MCIYSSGLHPPFAIPSHLHEHLYMPFISSIHTRISTFFLLPPTSRLVRTVSTTSMSTSVGVNVDHKQDTKNMIVSTTYPQPWLPAQDHRTFENSVVMDSGTTAPQPSSNTPQPHHQEQKRSRHRSRCRTLSKDDSEDQEETRPLLHPAPVVIDGITETYLPHDPSTLISSPEAGVSTTQDFYALYNPPDSKLWSIAR